MTPFVLDLELDLVFGDGTTRREIVSVSDRETTVVRAVPASVADIHVDPDRDHLIWRPAYVAPPAVDGVPLSATAPWVDLAAYAGTYHIEMFSMTIDVVGKEEGLYVDFGDNVWQLYPHEPHHFLAHAASVKFKMENGMATGFVVELGDGTTAEGVRVD